MIYAYSTLVHLIDIVNVNSAVRLIEHKNVYNYQTTKLTIYPDLC